MLPQASASVKVKSVRLCYVAEYTHRNQVSRDVSCDKQLIWGWWNHKSPERRQCGICNFAYDVAVQKVVIVTKVTVAPSER